MPRVTSLRPTRRSGRYAVHIDGDYAFAVSESFVARRGLYEGRDYDDADYADLVSAASDEAALTDACHLLNHRARSAREIRDRLSRKGHDGDVIEAVIARLRDDGLVDDAAFARAFVADKTNLSKWGRDRIARELRGHGIASATIAGALEGLDGETEVRRALAALGRLGPPQPPLDKARARAVSALMRRGYGADIARAAVSLWLSGDSPSD
jgi:regulatory protein